MKGVKAYILANLETYLAAVESARSVTIPRWDYLDVGYDKAPHKTSIEILPIRGTREYGNREGGPLLESFSDHDIAVIIKNIGGDPNETMWAVLRYDEAIQDMILADDTCGSRFVWALLEEVETGDMMQASEAGRFRFAIARTIKVREFE